MTIFEYAKCYGDEVEPSVSEQHVEVGAEPNVIVDDMLLSSKKKPIMFFRLMKYL